MVSYTRTALVTGGTLGLGYECALALARSHPDYHILIASRKDANSAAATINKATGQENVKYLPLDLASTTNVRAFAQSYAEAQYPPLQALLLNAGLQFPGEVSYTDEGVEKTFAINHVGHALLFHLLRQYLTVDARIIVTSSGTHDPAQKSGLPDAIYNNAEELAHPTAETAKYAGRQRYATSKLCNILWVYSLSRRLEGTGIAVHAYDPGLMPGTGLARDAGPVLRFFWYRILPHAVPLLRLVGLPTYTAAESGQALAFHATDERIEGSQPRYWQVRKQMDSSKDSYVKEKQDDLWRWTTLAVAKDDAERERFMKAE